ncbi:CDP-alcohol phosphatidyltransferase family protein [Paracoccus sediminilitoris]|uniref:CDP-alcohol phosphatidyltransferase family protein n=1 Tax=Paracoccus sediminilitoris TaxID=2202419 RepID=UPI001F3E5ABC|nr:CDP-alcohol phosphatidyltransferase family protein [Paracoccus sediminilitoris]
MTAPPEVAPAACLPSGTVPAGLAAIVLTWLTGLMMDQDPVLLAPALFLPGLLVVMRLVQRHYPHGRFGAANTITLMRMSLAAALLAAVVTGPVTGWTVAGIAAVSLALDGVDGFLARRQGLCSDFGARFDMEVDAALALILALHALRGGPVGAEILVLGIMRYLFVGASHLLPWLAEPLYPSWRRKAICVLQIATLIALQPPVLSEDMGIILARIAAAALIWSFLRDILWLRAHR